MATNGADVTQVVAPADRARVGVAPVERRRLGRRAVPGVGGCGWIDGVTLAIRGCAVGGSSRGQDGL